MTFASPPALTSLPFSTITQRFQMGQSITDLYCKDLQYLVCDSEAMFNFILRLLSDFFQILVAGTRFLFFQIISWHIQKKKKLQQKSLEHFIFMQLSSYVKCRRPSVFIGSFICKWLLGVIEFIIRIQMARIAKMAPWKQKIESRNIQDLEVENL